MLSCEFCEISKNTFFTKHLWTTPSVNNERLKNVNPFGENVPLTLSWRGPISYRNQSSTYESKMNSLTHDSLTGFLCYCRKNKGLVVTWNVVVSNLWTNVISYPANFYLLKVKQRTTRKKCDFCSKLTIKKPRWRHFYQLKTPKNIWFAEGVKGLALVYLLLTWNIFHTFFKSFYC